MVNKRKSTFSNFFYDRDRSCVVWRLIFWKSSWFFGLSNSDLINRNMTCVVWRFVAWTREGEVVVTPGKKRHTDVILEVGFLLLLRHHK